MKELSEDKKQIKYYIEKNRKRVVRAIFGRTILLFAALFIQILMLLALVTKLADYFFAYYVVVTIISFMLIVHITNDDVNPTYKLAWVVPVALLPIFGAFFYLFVRIQPTTKEVGKRTRAMIDQTKPYMVQEQEVLNQLENDNKNLAGLVRYMNKFGGGYPVYKNTDGEYFPLGENKFERMCEDLEKAEKFIFMEYFIVDFGIMLARVLEILAEKVKEGVEVRFMYDGMCTLSTVPPGFPKYLRSMGIKCQVYAPIRPALSTSQNHRDHRKILVIDGKIAYTGGINLADEYINEKVRFGHWKDTAVKVTGDAVTSFTMMFLQMWNVTEKDEIAENEEEYTKYICRDISPKCDGFVIGYGDSPYDMENVGEVVYHQIINSAVRYVHIMTPYLILDNETMKVLEYAAKRGIDVKIIGPHITDKPTAYMIARTYYEKLLRMGVKIYEYTPGFVHAKIYSSDDDKAVVGTINMDFRSLYLNFECAALFYKHKVVQAVEKDFQDTLIKCHEITMEDCRKYSKIKLIIGKILWIFAPLM